MAGGTVAVATGLTSMPIIVAYAGWGIAGIGMGVAFPTVPLAAMTGASEGSEAGDLSAILLTDTLGVGLGVGLGGASIAIAEATGSSLKAGIAGAFVVGLLAALAAIAVARRLPSVARRLPGGGR